MTVITLRLSDKLLHQVDKQTKNLHISRAEYIRTAIEKMNNAVIAETQRQRLQKISLKVRKESLKVNREFSEFEDDL
ncbi:MAG: ribbon-helix-helix protein, CopG family [Gammaproteobacteria bacterium]